MELETECKYVFLAGIWLERKRRNPDEAKIRRLKDKLAQIDGIRFEREENRGNAEECGWCEGGRRGGEEGEEQSDISDWKVTIAKIEGVDSVN